MQIRNVSDMNGDVLNVGTRIKAWYDGKEYTAVITDFEHYYGNVFRVIATRDDNGTEARTYSDAVVRFKS